MKREKAVKRKEALEQARETKKRPGSLMRSKDWWPAATQIGPLGPPLSPPDDLLLRNAHSARENSIFSPIRFHSYMNVHSI